VWKVLIADDEPKIRRGLRASVESLDEDMEVIGEAEDGEMALHMAAELHPDILLIDIRMPFLNGLELIEALNAVSRDWLIIIITGHDEFEYAQTALRLQVFDYLLKPLGRDILEAVINKAKTELSLRRASDKYTVWAREQLLKNMPALRERFLRLWLAGGMSQSEVAESSQFLGISIPRESTMILIRLTDRVSTLSGMKEEYRRLMILAVRSIAEEVLRPGEPPIIFDDDLESLVILAAFASLRELEETLSVIEGQIVSSVHQKAIIVHRAIAGDESLSNLYADLSEELSRRGNFGTFVLMAQNYMERHYREPDLSLEKVSAELELSSGYLSRLMKQEMGLSFVDFLTRLRVQKAVQFMGDPGVKIFEIAEKVGYRDQHYFSRAFKKVLGVPPVEYRKGGRES
jgi:two-component system, response regulator YesN